MLDCIEPGLLVLVPVLNLMGAGLKHTQVFENRHIPLALGLLGVVLALLWVLGANPPQSLQGALSALFMAVVQGVLCAGCAVYANQLYKQEKREQ